MHSHTYKQFIDFCFFKIRILLEWIWYLEIDEFDSIGNEIPYVIVWKSEFKSNIAN